MKMIFNYDIASLIKKQIHNASNWNAIIDENNEGQKITITNNVVPNYWVYGVLAKNKTETIKKFREQGFYATSVHINNNIYSVFKNKVELKGVNEFMNHFVAIPCGWWVNLKNKE
jgi:perosamine synthetase